MLGYVEDPGVSDLGHRRWLLNPAAGFFGTGSTGNTNALSVAGSHSEGSLQKSLAGDELVAWPAPGWFPSPWVFDEWSAAVGNGRSEADVSAARVKVTVDGVPASVSGVRRLRGGSGTGETLGWRTALPASMAAGDHLVEVSISGVRLRGVPPGGRL